MNMFSKIATFFAKPAQQKKWLVTSFLNWFSNFFQKIKGYFKAIPIVYNMRN